MPVLAGIFPLHRLGSLWTTLQPSSCRHRSVYPLISSVGSAGSCLPTSSRFLVLELSSLAGVDTRSLRERVSAQRLQITRSSVDHLGPLMSLLASHNKVCRPVPDTLLSVCCIDWLGSHQDPCTERCSLTLAHVSVSCADSGSIIYFSIVCSGFRSSPVLYSFLGSLILVGVFKCNGFSTESCEAIISTSLSFVGSAAITYFNSRFVVSPRPHRFSQFAGWT